MFTKEHFKGFESQQVPTDDINPKDKLKPDWHLAWGKYLWGQYGEYHNQNYTRMYNNRLYGVGKQDMNKHKSHIGFTRATGPGRLIGPTGQTREEEQKNYVNLNFDENSPLPKYREMTINKFMKVDHSVDLIDLSPEHNNEQIKKKYRAYIKGSNPQLESLAKVAQGIDPNLEDSEQILPRSLQELQLIDKMGGFKSVAEVVNKRMNMANFHESDWQDIKRKMLGDVFDNRMMACKDYTCKSSGRVKTRYVDILRFGYDYSRGRNGKDSRFWYEIVDYTITELRAILVDVSEQELRTLAGKYCGYGGNPTQIYDPLDNGDYSEDISNFKIPVIDYEVKTVDCKKYTVKRKYDDNLKVYEEDYNKKPYKDSKVRELHEDKYENIYRGKYIPGTEYVFDYGQQYDIPRPSDHECNSSYHVSVTDGPSMVDLLRPDADRIITQLLRLQNLVSKAAPKGMAIEWGALENMKIGSSDASPIDMLRIRNHTGDLIFRATASRGVGRFGGSGIPLKELEGGIGQNLNEIFFIIDRAIANMRQVTGFNEITDATSPNPETTARQAMLAASASNNALDGIYYSYKYVKKEVAMNMALRTNLVINSSGKSYEAYYPVAGQAGLQVVKMTKDTTLKKLGIMIRMRSTQEQKDKFYRAMETGMANGTVTPAEYLMVQEYVEDGRFDDAQLFLSYRENQRKAQEAQAQQQAIQAQGEQQRQLAQENDARELQKMQLEVQKAEAMSQINIREHGAKKAIDHDFAKKLDDHTTDNDIEQSMVEKNTEKMMSPEV